MLFDVRTYVCKPGTIKDHMALYEKMGMEAQANNLGKPFFYGITETGLVNSYMHIWKYENAADREQRRANMLADPRWITYMKASRDAGYLERQENMLMNAAPFWTPST